MYSYVTSSHKHGGYESRFYPAIGIGDFERRPEKSIDAKTASASIGW